MVKVRVMVNGMVMVRVMDMVRVMVMVCVRFMVKVKGMVRVMEGFAMTAIVHTANILEIIFLTNQATLLYYPYSKKDLPWKC
jgi:hypothetical protein